MAAGLTLDSGAFIAAEKGDARFRAILKKAVEREATITVPADVVSQVWRGNNPIVARLLQLCDVEDLDEERAKRIGLLLAKSHTSDVVDGAVVVGAIERGDGIVTSDPDDIAHLVEANGSNVLILAV